MIILTKVHVLSYQKMVSLKMTLVRISNSNIIMSIPKKYKKLGDLISIDGSFITAVLSMYWADYRQGAKKAKVHCGFNINCGIPSKVFLTEGNGGERPFEPTRTGRNFFAVYFAISE